ncbi:MAG: hypothetical protein JNJ83_18245 [Verrucomicrobiaceae bacterium]|nr:hypothetical protein [Verrucomicrobiaceae bacterium]
MKRILMLVLFLGLLGLGYTLLQNPNMSASTRIWVGNMVGATESGYGPDQLKVDIVDRVNYQRTLKKYPFVRVDVGLEQWMDSKLEELDTDHLEALTQNIKTQHPRYYRLLACTASSSQLQSLLSEFQDFFQKLDQDTTHMAVHVSRIAAGLGYRALIVTGRKLEDFSPEALSERKTDVFFNTCPHCGYEHACKVGLDQRGINLECSKCLRSYGVLAADEKGTFRYVNEFLTGYHPPAHFPYDSDPLHQMYTIWSAVIRHCAYVKDTSRFNAKRDAWQTALETQTKMRGDCEDSSVFLADWLLARGYQVRVALGHYGDMGGHAWCVAKVGGIDYLLESTEGPPDPAKPPYVADIGNRYVPDTLFDRDAIYVRTNPRDRFNGDYWSTKHWTRIQPRELAEQALAKNSGKKAKPESRTVKAKSTPTIASRTADVDQKQSAKILMNVEVMKGIKEGQMEWQITEVVMPEPPATSAQPATAKALTKK